MNLKAHLTGRGTFCSFAGTYRFFKQVLSNYGIESTFIDTTNLKTLEDSIKPNTKVDTIDWDWNVESEKKSLMGLRVNVIFMH